VCRTLPAVPANWTWGKRGQVQFVRSTLRAVPANWTCPLFLIEPEDQSQVLAVGRLGQQDQPGHARFEHQAVAVGKRGRVQFVRSTLRAVSANWCCPLFPIFPDIELEHDPFPDATDGLDAPAGDAAAKAIQPRRDRDRS
jgi:hypothetical protein